MNYRTSTLIRSRKTTIPAELHLRLDGAAVSETIGKMVESVLSRMNLDNMTSLAADSCCEEMKKLNRCCVTTEYGKIWAQGNTMAELCLYFYRKMEAKESQAPASVDTPMQPIASPLFEDYANMWWETYGVKKLQAGTAIDYRMNLQKHVIPFFKGKHLNEITTKVIQEFYNAGSEYANSTCRHWKTILLGIFDSAVEDELIEKNPARSKRLTMSSKKKERLPVSKEVVAGIQSKLSLLQRTDQLLLAILIYTGMRRGEMVGLQWRDIDFENKLIHISRQVSFVSNLPVVKAPKTASGVRAVPLLPELEAIFLANKLADAGAEDFVVSGPQPLSERSFRNTWLRISKKIGLPDGVTPHVLRHTFLTELEASGTVDLKTLQRIAGHSRISMTMDTYVHGSEANIRKVSQTGAGLYGTQE